MLDHDSLSQWHSIRPWRPTLSLSVREITSVSATFILSSPLAAAHSNSTDQEHDDFADNDDFSSTPNGSLLESSNRPTQIISEVLSKGLSVKVNGTPWQRVLMKIDEVTDEAVIILFGLMPARQYDIELGIVPGDHTLRGQFTTGAFMFHLQFSFSTVLSIMHCLQTHTTLTVMSKPAQSSRQMFLSQSQSHRPGRHPQMPHLTTPSFRPLLLHLRDLTHPSTYRHLRLLCPLKTAAYNSHIDSKPSTTNMQPSQPHSNLPDERLRKPTPLFVQRSTP